MFVHSDKKTKRVRFLFWKPQFCAEPCTTVAWGTYKSREVVSLEEALRWCQLCIFKMPWLHVGVSLRGEHPETLSHAINNAPLVWCWGLGIGLGSGRIWAPSPKGVLRNSTLVAVTLYDNKMINYHLNIPRWSCLIILQVVKGQELYNGVVAMAHFIRFVKIVFLYAQGMRWRKHHSNDVLFMRAKLLRLIIPVPYCCLVPSLVNSILLILGLHQIPPHSFSDYFLAATFPNLS